MSEKINDNEYIEELTADEDKSVADSIENEYIEELTENDSARIKKQAEDEYDRKKKKVEKEILRQDKDSDKLYFVETIIGLGLLILLLILAAFLFYKKEIKVAPVELETETVEIQESLVQEIISDEEEESIIPETDSSETDPAIDMAEDARKELPVGEYPQQYIPGKMLKNKSDDSQMKEICSYWEEYHLEAVWDLLNLPRVRALTTELKKTDDFYYCGSVNSEGLPEGRGLAIYARDTYYYGDWKNGLRDGKGMWVRLFIDKTGIVNGVSGVKEHQYSGEWKEDYPFGEGQETFIYDYPETEDEYIIRNAIGRFKDGYYNGKMYIITQDKENADSTTDWYGNAQMGSFTFLNDKKNSIGKRAIWEIGEGFETEEQDGCRWIMPRDNMDFGIAGLKR
ncbi:MAG: hypothetical protein KBS96_03130 [Lachnospiraceae bacterium]|nr:hypothetical protein [Candidatus Colinaster scatohippi]